MKKTLVCLIGPTASGKTEVALKLAKKINAEIISCDSMQVYKGIEIATSKPLKSQRNQVPHHLIDMLRPSQQYNAARFRTSARKIINDLHKRGKLPLLVGGTGLYLRALLDGLFAGPGQNALIRKRLYRQAGTYGTADLYKKLVRLDPQAAKKIHPNDTRRIIRALEVCQTSAEPISRLQKKAKGIRDKYEVCLFGIKRDRDELYKRIEQRVDRMFKKGLVAEIKTLSRQRVSKTAKPLLGYKEISGFLKGEYSKDEARDLLKKNTRHYAKRQLTWFRREKGINWIEVSSKDSAEDVARKILRELPDVGNRQR